MGIQNDVVSCKVSEVVKKVEEIPVPVAVPKKEVKKVEEPKKKKMVDMMIQVDKPAAGVSPKEKPRQKVKNNGKKVENLKEMEKKLK